MGLGGEPGFDVVVRPVPGPGLVVVAEGGRSAVGHRVVEVPGMASSRLVLLVPGAVARPGRRVVSPSRAFLARAPAAAASDRQAPGEPGRLTC
jgi:hypothetical protein